MAKPWTLRTSERRDFQRCIWRWWQLWREGLVRRGSLADELWFGTGVHIAFAEWYKGPGLKRGIEPVETWDKWCAEERRYGKVLSASATDEEVQTWEDLAEMGRILMEMYLARYGRDEHIFVVQPEQTFSIDVPWPTDQQLYESVPSLLARYVGTYDLVYRDLRNDRHTLEEHKTARTIGTGHLAVDNQGGSYWAIATANLRAAGILKAREIIAGIEYNFVRKGLPDDRPMDEQGYYTNKPLKADYVTALGVNHPDPHSNRMAEELSRMKLVDLEALAERDGVVVLGERSKQQPKPLFVRHMVHRTAPERVRQLKRIQDEALHMQAVRDGLLPLTKNPTFMCVRDCSVRDLCELDERGGDWKSLRSVAFDVRDPYADHRKSAAG